MPETAQPKKPTTFDELEHDLELDKTALSPGVVAAERQSVEPGPPPVLQPPGTNPPLRATEPDPLLTLPETDSINDTDLQSAAAAADATEDGSVNPDAAPIQDSPQEVHLQKQRPAHFWRRKSFWFKIIFILVVALAIAWFIRPSRLAIVNALGLRAELSVSTITLPEAGQQSALLKKVTITINGASWETDDHGKLPAKVPYGEVAIAAKKPGYQEVTKNILVDFDPFFYLLGGRQQDEAERTLALQLKAVGVPLEFTAIDWLTGEPLRAGAFSVGEAVAKPDYAGTVSLTLPATDAKSVVAKASFGGTYIDKEFEVRLDGSSQTITFVPEGKDYFISQRTGGLAVLSSDVDGSNITEVVPASPSETAGFAIAVSPNGKYGVVASTRGGQRDAQGALLQQLFVIDLANKKMTSIDQGQWFNFIDWYGDTLVYTVGERTPGAPTASHRLASLDAPLGKRVDLGAAYAYGAARVAVGSVLYQVSFRPGEPSYANGPELRVVSIKGGTEKNLGYQVQQISQVDEARLAFQSSDGAWREYNANNSQVKTAAAPASTSRAMLASTSADGQTRLVVDRVDGRPTLLARSVATGQEKQLYSAAALRGPIRMVNNAVIFRVADASQTADYVVSLNGGTPKKITDVTIPSVPITPPKGYLAFF